MNKEVNLTHKTFSGTIYLVSSGGIQIILKIGVMAVLARLISPNEYGLVGIAVIIVEFSKLFSQMGVGPCIVQRKELEDRHLTTGFTISMIMGLCFAGILILTAPFFEQFFRMKGLTAVLRAVSVVFLVCSITITGQALMQRSMKFKLIAIQEVVSYAIGYGLVGIILGYMGFGAWALVIANITQAVMNAIMVMIVQPFSKKPGFELKAFKELMYFGGGFTLARIGNFLAIQGDNMVVGRTLGAAALGLYGRAYQFMVMPSSLFGNALDRTLFPAMARVQDDKKRLEKAYLAGTSLIALVAIPISVLFIFLAPEIILITLGKKWMDVVSPFRILAFSLLFRMSYKMSDSMARATSAVYKRAWRQMVYAVAVFGGAYIGHFWGLSGVAFGVAVSLVINFILMSQLSIQLAGVTWTQIIKAHWDGILVGSLTAVVTLLLTSICRGLSVHPIVTFLVTTIGVGCLLFAALKTYPTFFIREDQRVLINKLVLKRFKKPLIQAA